MAIPIEYDDHRLIHRHSLPPAKRCEILRTSDDRAPNAIRAWVKQLVLCQAATTLPLSLLPVHAMSIKLSARFLVCVLASFVFSSAGCSPTAESDPSAQEISEASTGEAREAENLSYEQSTPDEATGNETPLPLEGTWRVTVVEFQGEKSPPRPGMPEVIEIDGDIFSALSGGEQIPTFSNLKMIFPGEDAAELDLERSHQERNEVLPCRMSVEGDILRIAMPMVPSDKRPDAPLPRPESFDTSTAPFLVLNAEREPQ